MAGRPLPVDCEMDSKNWDSFLIPAVSTAGNLWQGHDSAAEVSPAGFTPVTKRCRRGPRGVWAGWPRSHIIDLSVGKGPILSN
jgi:hypothetical protein